LNDTSNGSSELCTILGEMTDADKITHPRQFGRDPTYIRIRIRINPKIRIRIPDHFCFKFWRWRRFAVSGCSCYLKRLI